MTQTNGRPTTNGAPHALIEGDVLHLQNFRETDPEVVGLLRDADDVEEGVHQILEVGARALAAADASVDTSIVEKAFGQMTVEFDRKAHGVAEEIQETARALLDEEDGELQSALSAFKSELEGLFSEHFGEKSKESVISKLERVLQQAREGQIEAIKRVLDPDDDLGVLGRYRADIVKSIKEEAREVRKAVEQISEKIAVQGAESSMLEKTAIKGASFEKMVHAKVAAIVSPAGDTAEQVGRVAGCDGSQVGDELVTLNADDTGGVPARYVLEHKDRKLGMKAILDELDEAMTNRDSLAGIAVFSREENSPAGTGFAYNGNRALVVLDKDTGDDSALRMACMWARWVVRRQLVDDAAEIDPDKIRSLIDEACGALDRLTTIRRCHTEAQKKIGFAGEAATELVSDVEQALNRLRHEIDR